MPRDAPLDNLPLTVHGSSGNLRRPPHLFRRLVSDLRISRHAAWELMRRDIASQYRQSLLGVGAALLPALAMTAGAVMFRQSRLISVGPVAVEYPVFVLTGIVLWTAFVESLHAPIEGLVAEQALLARAHLPAEVIVLAKLGQVVFTLGIRLGAVAGAAAIYSVRVPWTVAFAPLPLAALIGFGIALGLFLAPLNLLYRDVGRGVTAFTTFWFFLTPALYATPQSGPAALVMKYNPVTPLLATARELCFVGAVSHPTGFAVMAATTVVLLALGWSFYRISWPIVVDRINP